MIRVYICLFISGKDGTDVVLMEWEGVVPREAKPQGVRRGSKNYTIASKNGAKVEVQLEKRAFCVKCVSGGGAFTGSVKTFSFRTATSDDTWQATKTAIGWDQPAIVT